MTNPTVLLVLAAFPSFVLLLVFINYRVLLNRKGQEASQLLREETIKSYTILYGSLIPGKSGAPYHGVPSFMLPLTATMLLAWAFAAHFVLYGGVFHPAGVETSTGPTLPATVAAGMLGAYLWVLYDLIDRYARIDLNPRSLYGAFLRLALGGALGYLIGGTLKPPVDVLVSFAIAALPVDTLRKYLRQTAQDKIGIKPHERPTEQPNLHLVQGMTPETIERLEEEGIRSIQDLASSNPIKLFVRTNLEMTNIIELVDQALLISYVGDRIGVLRPLGFRGAIEFSDVATVATSQDPKEQARGEGLVQLAVDALGLTADGVRNLAENVNDDPRTALLLALWDDTYRAWRGSTSDRGEEAAGVPMVTQS